MRRSSILALAMVGATMAAWSGTASAQGFEVYVGPPAYDPYEARAWREYPDGPRVYGYSRRVDEPDMDVQRPVGPGGCGTYRFWNGHECVDARYR